MHVSHGCFCVFDQRAGVCVCARYATAVNDVFDRWNVYWINSLCLCEEAQSPEPRLQIIETRCSLLSSAFRDGLLKPPPIVVTQDHVHSYATVLTPHLFLDMLAFDPHTYRRALLTTEQMRAFKERSADIGEHVDGWIPFLQNSIPSAGVLMMMVGSANTSLRNPPVGLISIWFASFSLPHMETSAFAMVLHIFPLICQ